MNTSIVAVMTMLSAVLLGTAPAQSADQRFADVSSVGVHNAYNKDTFEHLVDGLDSGAGMVEIDVWQNFLGSGAYQVGHNPGNDNNCVAATDYAGLRSGARDQDLKACLGDIRAWHDHDPGHRPMVLKLEMKNGFDANGGFGPDRFDQLLTDTLGAGNILKPADVQGSASTVDSAVRANQWPTRAAMAGKFVVLVETGAFESSNPFDHYHTDLEYADYLTELRGKGQLARAMMFPAINGASATDPRTGDHGGNRAQWYVAFDGDASTYVAGDTDLYPAGHYLLVMTDAQKADPAIDGSHPTVEQATDRVRQLAGKGANIISSDWVDKPVDSLTATRG